MRLIVIALLALSLSGCAEFRDIDVLHKELIRKSESGG